MNPVVYAAYDKDDRCLYVGSTTNLDRRKGQHQKRAPWFAEAVAWDEWKHPTIEAARMAERSMIQRLRPIHNVTLNWTPGPHVTTTMTRHSYLAHKRLGHVA